MDSLCSSGHLCINWLSRTLVYRRVVYRWPEQNHSDGAVIGRKISSVIQQSVPEKGFPRCCKAVVLFAIQTRRQCTSWVHTCCAEHL